MIWDWLIYIIWICSGLFCKPILCFCFELWYSSCFEVKCLFHIFPKRCSHTPMWIQILLVHRDCHVNPFQPACLSSSGSDHFNIRKITSQFSQRCLFHPSPSCLCFSRPPTLVSPRTHISHSSIILLMWSLFVLFSQCSYPVILMKMLHKFIILHSFHLRWIQVKICRLYPFIVSNTFSCRCTS